MNKSYKVVVGVIASAGLGLAIASAYADPHGAGTGSHAQGGMQHGMKGAMGSGAKGHGASGQGAGHSAMNSEERTAFQEKMRNARTPAEGQKLATAGRTEMHSHMHEHGTAHMQQRGPQAGTSPNAAPTAPAATEHAH